MGLREALENVNYVNSTLGPQYAFNCCVPFSFDVLMPDNYTIGSDWYSYAALNNGMDQRELIIDLALKDIIFPVVRIPRFLLTSAVFIKHTIARKDIAGAIVSTHVRGLQHVCAVKNAEYHINIYDTANRGIHAGTILEVAKMATTPAPGHRAIVYLQKKANWPE